jgi:hypothetical protein
MYAVWLKRIAVGFAALAAAVAVLGTVPACGSGSYTYQLPSYKKVGYDRSFKADLVQELPYAPQLVFFGGSRAVRFEPSYAEKLTHLKGFNAAFLVNRQQDSWAFLNYLYHRSPDTKIHAVILVEYSSFSPKNLHPASIVDRRFSPYFPQTYLERQAALLKPYQVLELLHGRKYGPDGTTLWNSYDKHEANGLTLDQALTSYLQSVLPTAGTMYPMDTVAKRYFQKCLKLLNQHGTVPLVIIMPYHPRVLSAFMSVGWGVKLARLQTYLKGLHASYDFRLLDYHGISSFDGRADWFYDGAHIKVGNSRLIMAHAVKAKPICFR